MNDQGPRTLDIFLPMNMNYRRLDRRLRRGLLLKTAKKD
ncbi:hypothetical protein BQ1740_1030 [Bacillus subtilis]|nr:hypothetical protein BQ1740_1030 [Bacillus subtilis]